MEKAANIIGLAAIILLIVGIVKFALPPRTNPPVDAKRSQLIQQFDKEAEASQARLKASQSASQPVMSPKP